MDELPDETLQRIAALVVAPVPEGKAVEQLANIVLLAIGSLINIELAEREQYRKEHGHDRGRRK